MSTFSIIMKTCFSCIMEIFFFFVISMLALLGNSTPDSTGEKNISGKYWLRPILVPGNDKWMTVHSKSFCRSNREVCEKQVREQLRSDGRGGGGRTGHWLQDDSKEGSFMNRYSLQHSLYLKLNSQLNRHQDLHSLWTITGNYICRNHCPQCLFFA